MAIKAGTISTGSAIASGIRGGRGFLAGKAVIFARIGPEGASSFSQIPQVRNPRGEAFSAFLRSMKVGDSSDSAPKPDLQPFTQSQVSAIAETKPQKSIAGIFGEPVKREQIGTLPVSSEPGEESVKTNIPLSLFSLKLPVPVVEQGPFRISKSIDNLEDEFGFDNQERVGTALTLKNTQVIQSQIEQNPKKAEVEIEKNDLNPMQIVLRIREVLLSRRTVIRGQAAVIGVETSAAAQEQNSLATENPQKFESPISLTKLQTQKPVDTKVSVRNNEFINIGRKQRTFIAPKLVIDEETNKARIEAIKAEKSRQESLNPGTIISLGTSVLRAGVTYLKQFEAGLVRQLDLKKDGSQAWMHKDASQDNAEATDERIVQFVESHTAVKEGRGVRRARMEEVDRVVRPPEDLSPTIDPEKVLVKVSIQELPEKRQTLPVNQEALATDVSESRSAEVVNEAEIKEVATGILKFNPNFVQAVLDTWSNMSDQMKTLFPKRQQMLAD